MHNVEKKPKYCKNLAVYTPHTYLSKLCINELKIQCNLKRKNAV